MRNNSAFQELKVYWRCLNNFCKIIKIKITTVIKAIQTTREKDFNSLGDSAQFIFPYCLFHGVCRKLKTRCKCHYSRRLNKFADSCQVTLVCTTKWKAIENDPKANERMQCDLPIVTYTCSSITYTIRDYCCHTISAFSLYHLRFSF